MSEDNSRFPAFPQQGDPVRVRRGTFAGMAGKVLSLDEGRRHARVLLTVYGRPVVKEIAYADIEPLPA
ncbi:MAG: KOW motif-containing protein [Candidatus Tectimicrobiota bacterium]